MGRSRSFYIDVGAQQFYCLLVADLQVAVFLHNPRGRYWVGTLDRDSKAYWSAANPDKKYPTLERAIASLFLASAVRLDDDVRAIGPPHVALLGGPKLMVRVN